LARSYHITKKEAVRRFGQGDPMSVVQYAEKRDLKKFHKIFRAVYATIHPSEKPGGLRNSVTRSAIKTSSKASIKKFLRAKI
jgi:hypothetical protein